MRKSLPVHLLEKFLHGKCTPAEADAVKEWYRSFENDSDVSISKTNHQAIKAKIQKAINAAISSSIKEEFIPPNRKEKYAHQAAWFITGVAAIFLMVFGLKIINQHPVIKVNSSDSNELVKITNSTKTIQKQVLSDGSKVWLYPGSRISHLKTFEGNFRKVSIVGKGFFEVTKDTSKPFIVYSEHMETKVWGTSFLVNDWKESKNANVVVATGKVSVRPAKSIASAALVNEVMLHPNEKASYSQENNKHKLIAINHVSAAELNIWSKVELSFDNAPLKEVIPVLNKFFNVNVIASDNKLNNYLLKADFNNLNFVSVMEILKKTFNVNYEINNSNIYLKSND